MNRTTTQSQQRRGARLKPRPLAPGETAEQVAAETDKIKLAYITHLAITQWLFLKGQNHFMAEHGFDLHAISSPGQRLIDLGKRDHLTIHEVSIARTISPYRDFVSLIRICRVLRQLRPDILHLSTPKAALLGALAAKLVGIRATVFLVRGFTSAQSHGWTRFFYRKLERLTVMLCNTTVCNAPSLLTYGRESGILRKDEGVVLASGMSNGVNLSFFDPDTTEPAEVDALLDSNPSDRIVIGFVGRMARDKGIELLADAWEIIREEFPNAYLLLVGPWESRDAVADDVRQLLIEDRRVIITGAVDDVRPYLKLMHLFAFPSYGEGFPNAPMEAAAFRIPVITTDSVGCVDAVAPWRTGMIIPPGDANALTNAIRTYLQDPDLRELHGSQGRLRIQGEFEPQVIWEAIRRLYVRLAEQHTDAPLPATGDNSTGLEPTT